MLKAWVALVATTVVVFSVIASAVHGVKFLIALLVTGLAAAVGAYIGPDLQKKWGLEPTTS